MSTSGRTRASPPLPPSRVGTGSVPAPGQAPEPVRRFWVGISGPGATQRLHQSSRNKGGCEGALFFFVDTALFICVPRQEEGGILLRTIVIRTHDILKKTYTLPCPFLQYLVLISTVCSSVIESIFYKAKKSTGFSFIVRTESTHPGGYNHRIAQTGGGGYTRIKYKNYGVLFSYTYRTRTPLAY